MVVDYTVYFVTIFDGDGFFKEMTIDNFDELLAIVEKCKEHYDDFTVESYTQKIKI
jgi:hypothetical protein